MKTSLRHRLRVIWNIVRNRPVVFRAVIVSDAHIFIAKQPHLMVLYNQFVESVTPQPRENWMSPTDMSLSQTFR